MWATWKFRTTLFCKFGSLYRKSNNNRESLIFGMTTCYIYSQPLWFADLIVCIEIIFESYFFLHSRVVYSHVSYWIQYADPKLTCGPEMYYYFKNSQFLPNFFETLSKWPTHKVAILTKSQKIICNHSWLQIFNDFHVVANSKHRKLAELTGGGCKFFMIWICNPLLSTGHYCNCICKMLIFIVLSWE